MIYVRKIGPLKMPDSWKMIKGGRKSEKKKAFRGGDILGSKRD